MKTLDPAGAPIRRQRLYEEVERRLESEISSGRLKAGDTSFFAGRLKTVEVAGDNVLLGQPLTFTKDNIDQFDF